MKEIKQLIEKYLAGETSLLDEKKLRDYFSEGNAPPELKEYESLFQYFEKSDREKITNENFDVEVMNKVASEDAKGKVFGARSLTLKIISAAATIVIAVGIYLTVDAGRLDFWKKTYSDEEILAAKQALNALAITGDALNKTREGMENLSTLDQAFQKLEKVSLIDKYYNSYVLKYLGEEQ